MCFMTKELLVKNLVNEGYLKNPHLIKAFEKIDRADFVPEDLKSKAYENKPLPLFGGVSMVSQPLVVAFMLELLDPQPGEKILEIGTGSGWQTALIAYCLAGKLFLINEDAVQEEYVSSDSQHFTIGHIISIEKESIVKKYAEENLTRYGILDKNIVALLCRDGARGYKKDAPYDKIIVNAVPSEISKEWKDSLKVGGRLITPFKESVIVLEKIGKDSFSERTFFGFSFQKLVS